ncbi:IMPACT family protein [Lacticaseibacillus songhuajiangensis]|jgi:uncharacterized YigZ family protein|uniref:IMPACT family protein n=1 Tax=Lacticaseibacillus songhuajiangensis TaxID=1296539 RepID=UPI000F7850E3|nr:YigZ family protein [Lacticaseibacillus songhuajiangensis]
MDRFTLAAPGTNEIIIKKSRFITSMGRVQSAEEAEQFVAAVRSNNKKANHNVWAARIAWPVAVERASDDGEPSGTAGSPTLRGLTSHDLSNVVAVTTRYFGGIKLGASGLIRAYSDSVTAAIVKLGIVQLVNQKELLATCDYSQYQLIENRLRDVGVTAASSDFTTDVRLHIFVDEPTEIITRKIITQCTNGSANFAYGGSRTAEIPVPTK